MAKTNNKQKPPNTLLSSQTTHPPGRANQPAAFGRWSVVRTVRNPPKWDFPLGRRRAQRTSRVADDETTSYVRENSESNGLIGRVFRFRLHRAHQRCVGSDNSVNAFHSGNIPLPATQDQPAAVKEVRNLWHPLLAVDPHVVDVRAALPDRPPRCALAARQPAGHQ